MKAEPDDFPGFPVGETKEEFEAAVDRLFEWRERHVSFAYGHRLPDRWGIPRGDGHILACPRMPVAKLGDLLPTKYIEALEQNQQIASCCRHPENHAVEAWFSTQKDADLGIPDVYIFHCTCGKRHARFCVGGGIRPFWECA